MTTTLVETSVLIFGGGWLGQALASALAGDGGRPVLTSRDADRRRMLAEAGFDVIDPADAAALTAAVAQASAIVVTAPPTPLGCPGAAALIPALGASGAYPDWIGYVSSTAVYGDRGGGWAFEGDALNAASLEGARRVRAEREWLDAGQGMGLTVTAFRLPGLYGPGRSVLERLKDGSARLVVKPGQVFNRLHVDDAIAGLRAAMTRPRPGRVYNLVDDAPAPAQAVMLWAAQRLGLPAPPTVSLDDPSVSEGMRRFYRDSKRISNARAKAELGWRPAYPSYREGLEAMIAPPSSRP